MSRPYKKRPPHPEPMELKVMPLLAKGMSNKEIEAALGKTRASISHAIWLVYTRLEITNRSQFILKYYAEAIAEWEKKNA